MAFDWLRSLRLILSSKPRRIRKSRRPNRMPAVIDALETRRMLSAQDITLTSTTIYQYQGIGSNVGLFGTDDPNAGNHYTYSLVDGIGGENNASFEIKSFGSQTYLFTAQTFNASVKDAYTIGVRAIDQFGDTVDKVMTLTIENPSSVALFLDGYGIGRQLQLSEVANTANPLSFGTLTTSDGDFAAHQLYLSGQDASLFQISGNQLQFIPGIRLNAQEKSSYEVTVDGDVAISLFLSVNISPSVTTQSGDPRDGRSLVAMNANGESVTVFGSNTNDGPALYVTRDSSAGAPFGVIQVNTSTGWSHSEYSPSIAINANGDFVVSWLDFNNANQTNQVLARRFDSKGKPLSGEILVANLPHTNQIVGTATSLDASGHFVVTWTLASDYAGISQGIYARCFDAAGIAEGNEFKVNTSTYWNQGNASIAMDAVGNFVIAWQSNSIAAQRFDAVGNPIGSEIQVSTQNDEGDPSISMDATGDFVITWQRGTGDGYDIYGRRYDASGNALAAEFQINQYTTGDQIRSRVSMNNAGGFAVAWGSDQQDGDGYGVYSKIYDVDGSVLSREFLVNNVTAGSQFPNGIAYNAKGDLIVVWNGNGQYGDHEYVQKYGLPDPISSTSRIQIASTSFPETQATGTAVGTLTTNDPFLATSDFTYSLVGGIGGDDNARFEIVGDHVNFTGVADYLTQNTYHVRVRATGTDGRVYENLIPFQVTPVNDPPTAVKISNSVPFVSEDADTSQPLNVATIAIVDDESGTNVLSLTGPDADSFQIVGDQLQLVAGVSLNVADQTTFLVTVNVSDPTLGGAVYASTNYSLRVQLPRTNVATIPYPAGDPQSNVATDANGNYVVVWHTAANNGSSPSLRAQRYDSTGTPVGNPIFVSSTSFPSEPTVSMDPNGDFVIAWIEHQPQFKTAVFARRFDSGGNSLGNEFLVSSSSADNIPTPSVAIGSSGDFVVTWGTYHQDNTEFDVYARRYNSAGAAMGGEFLVNTTSGGWQNFPTVAMDAAGLFVITWSGTGTGDNNGVFARRYDTDGSPLGNEFLVNSYIGGIETSPAIAVDSAGDTVIVWTSSDHDNGQPGIYAQRYSAGGQAVGSEFQINDVALPDLYQASVASSSSGDFIVTWADGGAKVYARRFNSQGIAYAPQIQINDQPSTAFVSRPFVDAADNGAFVITWSSLDFATFIRNTYAQRFPLPHPDRGPTSVLLTSNSVPENSPSETVVGTLSSQDRDPSQTTFSYELVNGRGDDDNGSFQISGDQLITQNSFDYESQNSYSIRVRVTDGFGKSIERKLTVHVTDLNEAPTDLSLSSTSVGDNSPTGTTVGQFSSSDPDTTAQSFTYTLVDGTGSDDNNSFTIDGDQLRTNTTFDLNTKIAYSILVRTTDQNGLSFDKPFTITVIDGNDAPTDIQLTATTVDENLPVGSAVGQFSSSDPDASTQTFIYSLVDGPGSDDNASFVISGNELQTNASFDFESRTTYSILVRTSDQGGLSFEKQFTITITDANDAPTDIQLDSNTVSENSLAGTLIGLLGSTDPDSVPQTFTYSLTNGVESNDLFTIVDNQLQTAASFDFEARNSYSVVVTTTDQGGLSFEKTFTINVLNAYESASITTAEFSIPENSAMGTVVGTLNYFVDSSVTTPVFSILSGNGFGTSAFAVNSAGVITVADPSQLNFEVRTQYSLTVQLDDGLNPVTTSVTIHVTDVNDPPNDISLSSTSIPENAGDFHLVGHLTSSDPDAGDTASFALVSGAGSNDNDDFQIVNNDLFSRLSHDYETRHQYFIRVGVTDRAGLSYEQQFAINVTDVNETPTNLLLTSNTVAENLPVGTTVGQFSTVDPDTGSAAFTYTLLEIADSSSFAIVNNELKTAASFDFESKPSYVILVRTTDPTGLWFEKAFVIQVSNVYEQPTMTTNSYTIPENVAAGVAIGTVSRFIDGSIAHPLFSIIAGNGGASAAFAIDNRGVVSVADASQIDYETNSVFNLTVKLDDGVSQITALQTVNLVDVNEAPTGLTLAGTSVDENQPSGTLVGLFHSNDPDLIQSFQYNLVAGTGSDDNASFVISGNQLFTAASFDFETKNQYSIRVRTTDAGGLYFEKAFTISVNDINEHPTDILLSSSTVAENQTAGTVVGTLSSVPSGTQSFTYSLVTGTGSDDNASFAIFGNQLKTTSSFDFETNSSYTVRIRTTDQIGGSFEKAFVVSVANVNESPTDLVLSPTSVAENQPVGTTVGSFTSTDPDANEQFVYHLVSGTGSADNIRFDISGGHLVTAATFDFETQSTYQIRVSTTDSHGLSFERAFVITVLDANDAPTDLSLSSTTVPENASAGTVVGLLSATDPDSNSQSFTYQLTTGEGSDFNSSFTIVGNELRTAKSFNFEAKNSYSIRVRVIDNGGLSFEKALTINVSDVNESPTDFSLSATSIAENRPAGSKVGTFLTIDPDLTTQTISYSLVSGTGSTDNANFSIVGDELRTATGFDFEARNAYTIRVRSTDQDGLWFEKTMTIGVTNVYESPTLSQGSFSILENVGAGVIVGSVGSFIDSSVINPVFSITSGNGNGTPSFAIDNSGVIRIADSSQLDYETISAFHLTVQLDDGIGQSTAAQEISLLDVNEAPTNLSLMGTSINENLPVASLVGSFSTTDPDVVHPFQYALVSGTGSDDNSQFSISGDQLFTAAQFDFETKNQFSIRVRTTDAGGLTFEKAFLITVNDVPEAPTDILLSSNSIAENQISGTVVGNLSTAGTGTHSYNYSLVAGPGNDDNASFVLVGDQLRTSASFDFEAKSTYSIRVRTTDESGAFLEKSFTLLITDVNEAPLDVALSPGSVTENQPAGTTVGTLASTDPDANDHFTYQLIAGTGSDDNASFSISANHLVTAETFDFETRSTYHIRVRTSDGQGLSYERALVINVLDANEAPTDLAVSSNTLPENSSAGTVVGIFSATDPDTPAQSFTYQLVTGQGDDFNSSFTIVGNELRTVGTFNFEVKSSYSIRVRVTDNGGLSFEKSLTINVIDVNEPPIDLSLSATAISENLPAGTKVGTFITTDPDLTNQTFTYSLVSGTGSTDNASFSIVGDELRTTSSFNFETKNSYTIRVRSTDQGGLLFEKIFVISVSDLPESPTALTLSSTTVSEHLGTGAVIGSFTSADPDLNDTFSYSLVSGTSSENNSSFTIVGNQLQTAADFDAATQSQYNIRVRTTDQTGLTFERAFTISVLSTVGVPTDILLSSSSIAETSPVGSVVGTFSSVESNGSTDTFTYTLVNGAGSDDNASFQIVNGQLQTAANLDFETKNLLSVRVRTTNQTGQFFEKAVSINLTDVAEAPTSLALQSTAVAENSPAGTLVGTFVTVDPDVASQSFTYSLVTGVGSDGNSSFSIEGNQLKTTAVFDAESANRYSIRVRTTDSSGLSLDRTFSITVTNLYESPTLSSASFSIPDHSPNGTSLGRLNSSVDSSGTSTIWSITGGNGSGAFAISNAGVLSVANSSLIDFSATPTFSLTVQLNDGTSTVSAPVTVAVTFVDRSPVLSGTSAINYTEGQVATPINTAIVATDSFSSTLSSATVSIANYFSGEDLLAFAATSATGNIAGTFDASSGILTISSAGASATVAQFQAALRGVTYQNPSSNPTTTTRSINYRLFDGSLGGNTITSTVAVKSTNNAPLITGTSDLTYTEGQAATAINPVITVSDVDNSTQFSATVRLTTGFNAAQDVLAFINDGTTMGNIVGNYVSTTGTLTLTSAGSTATVAQFQAAIRSVTYRNTSDNPTTSRIVSFQVSDGSLSSTILTTNITVVPVNTAPTLSGSSTITVSEGAASAVVNSQITVADADSTTFPTATVSLANYVSGSDILGFTPNAATGDITSSFNAATGVLTLASTGGAATAAQFQAGLRVVTYRNASSNPVANRLASFRISDGALQSNAVTTSINVTPVDDAPTLNGNSNLTYTEGQGKVAINTSITVGDTDNTTLASATVLIKTGFDSAQDVLGFVGDATTMGNITGSYDGLGKLTLTSAGATATVAQFQAALQAVTYQNTSGNPTASRSITFQINDGILNSNLVTTSVAMTPVNNAPTVSGTVTLSYTEGQAATAINSSISVTDVDNTTLSSAIITITNYVASEDLLSFAGSASTGNIVGLFDPALGQLTLTSSNSAATVAQFQTALQSVSYRNTSINPSLTTRTVSYQVSDGQLSSSAATSSITITPVDTAPIITGNSNLSYTEGQSATPINPGFVINDVDSPTLASVTIQVTTGYVASFVALSFVIDQTTMGTIKGTFNSSTGALTLASGALPATPAQFQAAVRAVSYTNTNPNPPASSTVTFQAFDGFLSSNTLSTIISITPVNNAPTLSGGGTLIYTEGQTATAINSLVTIADVDNTTLSSATVTVMNYQNAEDLLSYPVTPATGNIVGSFDSTTGTLTLTSAGATATVAQFQTALRAVAYRNASTSPTVTSRNVAYRVSDGNLSSIALGNTITIVPVNSAPTVTGSSFLSYTEGQAASAINPGIVISDTDNATLYSATVRLTTGFKNNQDILGFVNDPATMGTIQGSYDPLQGILQLTSSDSSATVAQFQAALRSVTYLNTSGNPSASRAVTFQASDGGLSSNTITSTITITAVNTAPTLSGTSVRTYTEGQAPAVINSSITVADVDNLTLASAIVSVVNHVSGEDILAFTSSPTTGNITGSFDNTLGTLTLTSSGATATVAQFQAALRLVTYSNSSGNPTTTTRSIAYQVSDGLQTSNVVNSTVSVAAVNSAPVVTGTSDLALIEGDLARTISPNVVVSDADNTTLLSATVRVTTGLSSSQDVLGFVSDPATMGNITGNYVPGAVTLTLTSPGATATVAQFQAALRAVTYRNIGGNPSASRVVTFQVSDGSLYSTVSLSTVTVTAVNSAPTLLGNNTLAYTEGGIASPINPTIVVSDVDNTTLSSASVTIANNVSSEDQLLFTPSATTGNIAGTFDSTTGVLTLTSAGATATVAQFQSALRAVTYRNSSSNPVTTTRIVNYLVSDGSLSSDLNSSTVTIRAVDNAPLLSGANTLSYTEKQAATVIHPTIALSDIDNTTLLSAKVRISSGYSAPQDVLGFVNDQLTMGSITGTYDTNSGILYLYPLSSPATVAQFQAALRAVTYQNTSANPTMSRQIGFEISDGILSSNILTTSVTITPVNDAPALTGSATATYTEGSTAVSISSAMTVTDVDNTTHAFAKIIATNFAPNEDVLSFTGTAATGNIAGSFDAVSGIMSLTSPGATATVAQFQAAMRAVTYRNTSSNPTTTTRTFTFQVSDGALWSDPQPGTVRIVAINNPALLTGTSSPSYAEGQSATVINPVISVNDVDNLTLSSATVSVINGFSTNQVFLGFTNDPLTMGNIAGNYSVATGILTLTSANSTATLTQFQAALRSVTYQNLSLNPLTSSTVNFQVSDAGGVASNILATTISITPVNNSPTLTAGATQNVNYSEGNPGIAINPLISVSDPDNFMLSSATISLINYVAGEDILSFTNQATAGNITGSFDSSTGTLVLTSTNSSATVAQFQNALRLVTYRNSSNTPSTTVRNVTWQVSDGSLVSNLATSTITVYAVNNAPVLTGTNSIDYTENQASVVLMPNIVLTDVDSPMVEIAIVNFTNFTNPTEDILGYVPAAGSPVRGSVQAGVLYLSTDSGSVSLADLQEAMRRVTYRNISDNPNNTPRIVGFKVYDMGGQFFTNTISNTVNSTVNITTVNDAPTLSVGTTLNYTENQVATPINATIKVTDPDNANLTSATVTLTNYVFGEDVLSFTSNPAQTGTIIGSFDATSGVMTLSVPAGSSATVAQFRAALSAVKYQNVSENPVSQSRQADFRAFDGTAWSDPSTSLITVKNVDDAPVLSVSSSISYTERQAPTVINPNLILSDIDNVTLSYATAKISSGLAASQDVLDFIPDANTGPITSRYSATSGTLTLEVPTGSTATLAQFQAALRAVTYFNTSGNPVTVPRSVTYQASDGAILSTPLVSTISIISVNNPPTLSGPTTLAYRENQTATAVNGIITVADVDNTTLQSATVSLVNYTAAVEGLNFLANAATGNIVGAFNSTSGVLTLTSANASATVAQFQSALRQVTYLNSSDNPVAAPHDVAFQVFDGASFSNVVTTSVKITPVNDAPILNGSSVISYTEDDSPSIINSAITINEPDNSTLFSATVKITTGFLSNQDSLGFVGDSTTGDIAAAPILGGLVLTSPSGTGSFAQFQAALRRVTYFNSSPNPSLTQRNVTYQVSDGSLSSSSITSTISVTPVNDPTLLAGSNAAQYTEGTDVAISPGLRATDPDNTTLASATIRITNFVATEDALVSTVSGTTIGNITSNFNSTTGVLTLTSAGSTATLTQFQTALQGVKYRNTSRHPDTTTRLVEYTVTDDKVGSNVLTSSVKVTAIDDAPLISGPSNSIAFTEGSAAVPIFPAITLSDPDDTTLVSATVTLTGYVPSQDLVTFDNNADIGNITGTFSTTTGVLTLTSTSPFASISQFQNALRSVKYQNVSKNPTGTRSAAFQVYDGTKLSAVTAISISQLVSNDAPTLAGVSAIIYPEASAATPINTNIVVQDADSASLKSATIRIVNYKVSEDVLNIPQTTLSSSHLNMTNTNGVMTLTARDSLATPALFQAALRAVTYSNTSKNPDTAIRQIEFQVNDGSLSNATSNVVKSLISIAPVNDPPSLTSKGIPQGMAGTVINFGQMIALSDVDSSPLLSATIKITGPTSDYDYISYSFSDSSLYQRVTSVSDYTTKTLVLRPAYPNTLIAFSDMSAALASLTFQTNNSTPSRSITIQVDDGLHRSNLLSQSISVTENFSTPSVNYAHATFYDGSTAVPVAPAIDVVQVLGSTLTSATVKLTGSQAPGDLLKFSGNASAGTRIVSSYDPVTRQLTLTSPTGSSTVQQFEAALRLVTYINPNPQFNRDPANVEITVTNPKFVSEPLINLLTFKKTGQNQPPVISGSTTVTYDDDGLDGGGWIQIAGDATVTAPGSTSFTFLKAEITSGFVEGDSLYLSSYPFYGSSQSGSLSIFPNPGKTMTLDQMQQSLQSLYFYNWSSNPTNSGQSLTRTVSIRISDGFSVSTPLTITINVIRNAHFSWLGGLSTATYVEGQSPVPINASAILTRPDGRVPDTISLLVDHYRADQDVFEFHPDPTTTGDIQARPADNHYQIQLCSPSGTATFQQFLAAYRSITYRNTSQTPDLTPRRVSTRFEWTSPSHRTYFNWTSSGTVFIVPTNDGPIIDRSSSPVLYSAGQASTPVASGLLLSDPDDSTLVSATIKFASGFVAAEDVLTFVGNADSGDIIGSFVGDTLTLISASGTATVAQFRAAIAAVKYQNLSTSPTKGDRILSVAVSDGKIASVPQTPLSITVAVQ